MRRVSLREVYRCPVFDAAGKQVGFVDDVLFHACEPRAVGYSVRSAHLVKRIARFPNKYLALVATEFTDDDVLRVKVAQKHAWGKKAARELGFSWDESVIWYGQHIHTENGTHLGKVSDALVSPTNGSIGAIEVTDGTVSDLTLGKRTIPAELIRCFDLANLYAIIVDDAAANAEYAGGLAVHAAHLADAATRAAHFAARAAAPVTKAAGKAAARNAGKAAGWLSKLAASTKDAYNEGLK